MPVSPPPLRQLLRDGLVTAAFCCVIALALTVGGHGAWDEQLVYSLAIGGVAWLVIEAGRLAFAADGSWPHGWRGAALVAAGSLAGLLLGSALGDRYSGQPQPIWRSPWLASTLVITVLAAVAVSFFMYSRAHARRLALEAAQAQRDAVQARLSLLQAQLEPHMLFNTLANLRALIASDTPRALDMLDHLNAWLRATLGASRTALHPLADEFALLQDYLALIAVRLGPRLAYRLELPPALAALPVPALVLQPLVENAIRHGLEPQLAGGTLQVRAELLPGALLCLSVHDDGAGLSAALPAKADSSTSHFGLSQVRQRLTALYGPAGTLELIAGDAGGTRARVIFPIKNTDLAGQA